VEKGVVWHRCPRGGVRRKERGGPRAAMGSAGLLTPAQNWRAVALWQGRLGMPTGGPGGTVTGGTVKNGLNHLQIQMV
jgi:hypothetical protein